MKRSRAGSVCLAIGLVTAGLSLGCYKEGRTLAPHRADDGPATRPLTRPVLPPLSQPAVKVSAPELRMLPAVDRFVYASADTNFRDIAKTIEKLMGQLNAGIQTGKFKPAGPPTFIYLNATPDPEKPFKLEVGFPAESGNDPGNGLKVRALAELTTMAVDFAGPISAIDKAYDRVMPASYQSGRQLTGESREIYTRFTGPDSPDNQVTIGIGLK